MSRNRITCGAPAGRSVAIVAAVFMRRCGELAFMAVLVTIRASREIHAVFRLLAFWLMTLGARHPGMLSSQWIIRLTVI